MMRVSIVVVFVMCMMACGGGNGNPMAPSVPVVAQYAGVWSGEYRISGCNESGGMALAHLCYLVGQPAPYRLTLAQAGASVSGSFVLGSLEFTSTSGTVRPGGGLTLNASLVSGGITMIATWELRLTGTALTGTLTQVWTSATLSGQTNFVGTIITAGR